MIRMQRVLPPIIARALALCSSHLEDVELSAAKLGAIILQKLATLSVVSFIKHSTLQSASIEEPLSSKKGTNIPWSSTPTDPPSP